MVDAAQQVGSGIAGAFIATAGSSTTLTKDKTVHSQVLAKGPSYSIFEHVRSNRVPTKFEGVAPNIYWKDIKQSISNTQKFQTQIDIVPIWNVQDIIETLNAHPIITADISTSKTQNTLDYFFSRANTRTLFANVSNCTAHVVLYNCRARDTCPIGSSPLIDFQIGLDDLSGATTTNENLWGMVPEMSPAFRQNWEVLNKEAFSLDAGQEHLHTFNIRLNKTFNVEKMGGASVTTGNLGGFSYGIFAIIFGGLVTENDNSTEVAIGSARVNTLTTLQYYTRVASTTDQTTATFKASTQDQVDVPKKMSDDLDAEVTITTV